MPYGSAVPEDQLNEWSINLLRELGKEDGKDIITRNHPTLRMMEKKGAVKRLAPRTRYVEDIIIASPSRKTQISASQEFQPRDRRPIQTHTEAYFDTIVTLETLTMSTYKYMHMNTKVALGNYLKKQKKATLRAVANNTVDTLWNGDKVGDNWISGLKDMIQFAPGTAPTNGAVGNISVAKVPDWKNVSFNYNAAHQTLVSGGQVTSFLNNGTTCFLAFYQKLTDTKSDGEPDMFACNDAAHRFFEKEVEAKRIFRDTSSEQELGVDAMRYRNGVVYWDDEVPDDPNNGDYGVVMAINTNAVSLVFEKGIENMWQQAVKLEDTTGYGWDNVTGMAMTCSNRRALGVFFGLKEATSS